MILILYSILWKFKERDIVSDGTIYRIVSNIAIVRSYRGISLSRYLPLQKLIFRTILISNVVANMSRCVDKGSLAERD